MSHQAIEAVDEWLPPIWQPLVEWLAEGRDELRRRMRVNAVRHLTSNVFGLGRQEAKGKQPRGERGLWTG